MNYVILNGQLLIIQRKTKDIALIRIKALSSMHTIHPLLLINIHIHK